VIDEFRSQGQRRVRVVGQRGAELTSREWDVLDLMREGLATSAIPARLYVSPVTVRRHISQILRKLRVKTREEGVRLLERG
jgi:DNA-binding NarL/FixJ family response regulator